MFNDSKYTKWYYALCANANKRQPCTKRYGLHKREIPTGHETHHILPRCLGGSDEPENLVYLTYREHYIAHHLLTKMNPSYKLKLAFWYIVCGHKDLKINAKTYETLRADVIDFLRNREVSEESIQKMKANLPDRKGANNAFYERAHSEETKANLSEKAKVRYQDKESHPRYKAELTEETKQEIRNSLSTGIWVVNYKMFLTLKNGKAQNFCGLTAKYLYRVCKKPDVIVGTRGRIPAKFKGDHTWRSLGFDFIPKSDKRFSLILEHCGDDVII